MLQGLQRANGPASFSLLQKNDDQPLIILPQPAAEVEALPAPPADDLLLPPYARAALRAIRTFHDFLVEAGFSLIDLPAPLTGSFDDEHIVNIYLRLGRREGLVTWLYGAIRTVHTSKQFDAFVRTLPSRSIRVPRLRALLDGTISPTGMRDQIADLIALLAKRSGSTFAADLDSIVESGLYGEVIGKPVDIVELGIRDETFADLLLAAEAGEVGDRFRALALAVLTNVARGNSQSTAATRISDVSFDRFREGIGVLLDSGEVGLAWRLVQDLEALGKDCEVGGLRALYRARRVSGPAAGFIHPDYLPQKRQAAINEGIDRDYRKSPARTLASMINFALLSEQSNRGIAIAEYALALAPSGPPDDQRVLGGAIAEAMIAQGEFERAEAMFDFQPTLGGLTDALYAFYADRRGAAPWNNFFVTPKGRLNTYMINRRLPDLKEVLMSLVASHPDLISKNPQNYLLLANASRGSPLYVHYVNLFLSAYGSGAVKLACKGGASGLNVLAHLRWDPPHRSPDRAARDETSKVTVLMAAKNAAATLAYSLTSIINQTHQNWELLLCDDGSEDQTFQIAEHFARRDDRIRIFKSAASQGPYNIRNNLLAAATGVYVTTQDADDVSAPSRLQQQVELLDGQKDVLGVVGRWVRVGEDGTFVFFRDGFVLRQSTVSTMYRREVLQDFGPFDSVRFGADSEYIERVRALEGDSAIAQMSKPLLFGLWSNQSLTRSSGSEVDEIGYRAPMRRAYAEMRMRERLQGDWRGDSTRYPNYIAPTNIVEVKMRPDESR